MQWIYIKPKYLEYFLTSVNCRKTILWNNIDEYLNLNIHSEYSYLFLLPYPFILSFIIMIIRPIIVHFTKIENFECQYVLPDFTGM